MKSELAQIDDIIEDLLGVTETAVKTIGTNLVVNLARTTPRDTGFAGSNWVASKAPGTPGAIPQRNPLGAARARGAQVRSLRNLQDYRLEDGEIHVGNPTPYVENLDRGSSPQQRPGFVRRGIDKAVADARRTVK